jgi:hypothetical protein
MAIDISGAVSAYEEREKKRRAAEKKRRIILALLCVGAVVARLTIKNPPPPKPAYHDNYVALPGVLEKMSLADQAKLKPELLAQLKEADSKAKVPTKEQAVEAYFAKGGRYTPADAPVENLNDKELQKEFQYQYARRQKMIEQKKEAEILDPSKTMLVMFKNGRYVKARRTRDIDPFLAIEVDSTMAASLNKKMILSVSNNALTWVEPVPAGSVRLKPAKGITITVNQRIADQITILKPYKNES